MIPKIKHLSVNWTNGMKISKSHFLQQEFANHDLLKDVYCQIINPINYGLLPELTREDPSLNIKILPELVELTTCRGITLGGIRIEIIPEIFSQPFKLSLDQVQQDPSKMNRELLVVVAADYYSRNAVGKPIPEESPLRFPFTTPNYRLEAIPLEEVTLNGALANHLPLAKVRIESGVFKLVESFVPPSTTMESLEALKSQGKQLEGMLLNMLPDVLKVVQKININHQNNRLADNLCQLAESLLSFLSQNIDAYQQNWKYQTPVYTIDYFKKMARVFKVSLYCLPERENLLNYFSKWSDFRPGELERTIEELLELHYNHLDIEDAMKRTNRFISVLFPLFQKLANLNYIEQRTDEFFV